MERQKPRNSVFSEGRSSRKRKWDDGERQAEDGRNDRDHSQISGKQTIRGSNSDKRWIFIKEKVEKLLFESFQFPLEEINLRDDFRSDASLTNPDNSKYVEGALENFLVEVNVKTLRQFYDMYGMKETHIFDSSRSQTKAYYNMDESFDILKRLLEFQFEDRKSVV